MTDKKKRPLGKLTAIILFTAAVVFTQSGSSHGQISSWLASTFSGG